MAKLQFEGTIRAVRHIETEKKDLSKEEQALVIRDGDGVNRIVYRGGITLDGFAPEDTVKVTVETTQTTLKEHDKKE